MFDRCLGQDTVAEIENVGSVSESLEHALDTFIESGAARDQRQRIEIALQRNPFGQSLDRYAGLDRGVEADIAAWFEKYYSIRFRNYPVTEDYMHEHETIACE